MDNFAYNISFSYYNGRKTKKVKKMVISRRILTLEEIQEGVSRYYNKTNDFTYNYTVTSVIIF